MSACAPPPGSGETVEHHELASADTARIRELVDAAVCRYGDVQERAFLADARRLARALPRALARALGEIGAHRGPVAVVVRGLGANEALEPTPPHWSLARALAGARRDDFYLCLTASLLGELFAWSTLQHGKLVTDVLPIPGEEDAQSGHGTTLLAWHTEDAFHPRRCDHLLLLCLRNPGAVPTTVARLGPHGLEARHRRTLREPRFVIHPDPEHVRAESSLADAPDLGAPRTAPAPVCVLTGPPSDEQLCIDPLFMEALDPQAGEALAAATDALERSLVEVALAPGDLLVIDNRRAVHGRGAFTARHDGRDRWLKKAMAARELHAAPSRIRRPHGRVLD